MEANPLASLEGGIYGPLYFSAVLCTAFYGVTCMQTFFYYVHYPDDSRRMKIFVAVLWALDTIHEALTVAGVYKYVIAGLVNPTSLLDEIPELNILSEGLVALPTQGFFMYRIYALSGKNIIAPLLWVLVAIYQIVYEAKSFYSADGSIHVVGLAELADNFFSDLTISLLSVNATVDALIAIAMTYLLFRKRAATGFASTAHILQRLTMFAVNTGTWTATFAILSAVLMHIFPSNPLYVVFSIPISSVYCNTLLANLNGRAYIRGEAATHNSGGALVMVGSPMSSDAMAENQSSKFGHSIHLDIRKTTEVASFADADQSGTTLGNLARA